MISNFIVYYLRMLMFRSHWFSFCPCVKVFTILWYCDGFFRASPSNQNGALVIYELFLIMTASENVVPLSRRVGFHDYLDASEDDIEDGMSQGQSWFSLAMIASKWLVGIAVSPLSYYRCCKIHVKNRNQNTLPMFVFYFAPCLLLWKRKKWIHRILWS